MQGLSFTHVELRSVFCSKRTQMRPLEDLCALRQRCEWNAATSAQRKAANICMYLKKVLQEHQCCDVRIYRRGNVKSGTYTPFCMCTSDLARLQVEQTSGALLGREGESLQRICAACCECGWASQIDGWVTILKVQPGRLESGAQRNSSVQGALVSAALWRWDSNSKCRRKYQTGDTSDCQTAGHGLYLSSKQL